MTEERAAVTAAEVDRVVIGVHRSVGDVARSQIKEAVSAIGLQSVAYWSDLAVFMVEGRLTDELVRTRYRYSATSAEAAIAELREKGLLGAGGRPSDSLQSAISVIESSRIATAADLWASNSHLAAIASDAAVMLRRGRGPLVEPYRALSEPTDTVALLWHRLIGLRYLRADAHASAWHEAGLTAAEVVDLTAAWQEEPVDSPQPQLVAQGFLTPSGMIAAAGVELREGIEAETNRRSEACYQALDSRAWAGWMAAMAELPPHE